jgi:hypothetical protein
VLERGRAAAASEAEGSAATLTTRRLAEARCLIEEASAQLAGDEQARRDHLARALAARNAALATARGSPLLTTQREDDARAVIALEFALGRTDGWLDAAREVRNPAIVAALEAELVRRGGDARAAAERARKALDSDQRGTPDPLAALAQNTPSFPTPVAPTGSPWDGLNLLLTRQRLTDLQNAIALGDATALRACSNAIDDANAALAQQPNPIVGVFQVPGYYTSQRAVQQQLSSQIRTDGRAALALAIGYALTGQQSYADAAKQFLTAWEQSLTQPVDGQDESGWNGFVDQLIGETGGDTALVTHYSFPLFIYAYDVLNGFGQISDTDKDAFKTWLAPFIHYRLSEERFVNNHQSWQVLFMGCAAHATEDQHLFDTAVAYYRHGLHHQQIAADGAMWRELARGQKAATYSLMALEAMVQFVVIADNHGVHDLRDAACDRRGSNSTEAFELEYITGFFHHSGVASGGGRLRDAFDAIRNFVNDPTSWNRWHNVTQTYSIDGPAGPQDWGWVYEVAQSWWQDGSYAPLVQAAPYGLDATSPRAYTLYDATLIFRPVLGQQVP